MVISCRQKPKTSVLDTDHFKKTLDSVNYLYDHGHHEAALHYVDSVFAPYSKLDWKQQFDIEIIRYNYYNAVKGDKKLALQAADKLLNYASHLKEPHLFTEYYSRACLSKGDVLFDLGQYNQAYSYFYQGKQIIARGDINQDCLISDYTYRMGMIMYKQEHYELAADYFKSSFNESSTCGLSFSVYYRRQEILSNIGLSYSELNQADSALLYYNKALNFVNHIPRKYIVADSLIKMARGVIYGNLASVYYHQKNYAKAEELTRSSIAINIRPGYDNLDAVYTELKLVQLFEKQNKIDSMLPTLQLIRQQLKSLPNADAEADWHILMSHYYQHKRNFEQSLFHLKHYEKINTSLNARLNKLKAYNVAVELKRFDKDYRFKELQKSNELKTLYLTVAIVFVLLVLIIMLLIFYNWRKSKSNIKVLRALNARINEQNGSLENTLQQLKVSHEDKDRILRTVAHDLRNPIGGIAALTAIMIDEDNYTEEQQEYLKIIKDTSNNSLELINEIMEATNNGNTLNKQWVDINTLLNSSVELMRFKAAEKNQQIMLQTLEEPEKLFISREKIWRVMSNLISNAIKFSPVGGIIKVLVIKQPDGIRISVNDNGIGIPDKYKRSVFNMFTDAKRPGTVGEKSFGLGLSICRQIIELHNGQIWFENNSDNGTTFYIKLHQTAK